MALTDQEVLAALKKILYPGFTRDIVSAGAIRNVVVDQANVRFEVVPGPGDPTVVRQIQEQARVAARAIGLQRGTASLDGSARFGAARRSSPSPSPTNDPRRFQ